MTEKRIKSWEELALYAASSNPEDRAKAVACIEAQRSAFPDQISEDDVMMVKGYAYMNRKTRRLFVIASRRSSR